MNPFVYGLLTAIVVYIVFRVTWRLSAFVQRMGEPERWMRPTAGSDLSPAASQTIEDHQPWAQRNGFEWVDSYVLQPLSASTTYFLVWRHTSKAITFTVSLAETGRRSRVYHAFATEFPDGGGVSLSTVNDRGGITLPLPPGQYVQSFPWRSLNELVERHRAGMEGLAERLGTDLEQAESGSAIFHSLCEQMRRRFRYVQSLRLWRLRLLWWVLWRPWMLAKYSVEEQIVRGIAEPPETAAAS